MLSTMTRERLRRLELVQSIETLWTATKGAIDFPLGFFKKLLDL